MKLFTMLATVLLFTQSSFSESNALTKNQQTLRLMNSDYQLVDMNLDSKKFFANSMLLSLTNVTDKGLNLNIMNNICPKVPGKPSCLAMPYPLFSTEFKLGTKKIDNCGIITQKSTVVSTNNPNNPGERAQLILRDYRYMTCRIMMKANLEIELNIKSKSEKSQSTLWLNKIELTDMPNIHPKIPIVITPLPGKPVIPQENFFGAFAVNAKGPFFSDATGLKAEVTLDEQNQKIMLQVLASACNGLACQGFNVLISRELEIQSVKANKCGELTYFTKSVSVYDAYPAVVGATHTYVTVELQDTRNSLCGNLGGTVAAFVLVQEVQMILPGPGVSVDSEALFELSQIK